MKKIFTFISAALLVLLLTVAAFAATPRIVDSANLIGAEEEAALLIKLNMVSEEKGMDIVILTVDSLDGYTPREYADDYYDYNGFSDSGLLLLVSMEERDWYISTTGYGIIAFTDRGLEYIGECIVEDLGDGNYYEAFVTFIDLCDDYIDQAKSGRPYDTGHMPRGPYPLLLFLACSFGFGFLFSLIFLVVHRAKLKSVHMQKNADGYVKRDSFNLTRSKDIFLYNTVSRVRRQSSSGSGGGSSTHTSSSGRTHGGRGGKF